MDRLSHEFAGASPMGYAQQQRPSIQQQQQQQFGFHPVHQQYPPSMPGAPFMPPPHPSMQQFPYPHPMQPQPQPQLVPRPQMYPLQQPPQGFHPHLPPHLVAPPYPAPYDSAPPPPSDPELQKRVDKLVEYSIKNGPEFEAMIRDKQKDNPEYSFLFGGEGHAYYRYKLWVSSQHPPFPPSSIPMMPHPPNPMMNPSGPHGPINAGPGALGAPPVHQPPFSPYYEQQQQQHPFVGHSRPDYDQSAYGPKGLSNQLPTDIAMELSNVLVNLNGTKESIKSAKTWFMQRAAYAPALADALRDRVFSMDDSARQMHVVYLANDILFDSLQRRMNPRELDNEALAFRPVLGPMLTRIYHNPQNKEENQSRLRKILQFWASKEVYDQDTISSLEGEMKGGLSSSGVQHPPNEASGMMQHPGSHGASQWQVDKQGSLQTPQDPDLRDRQVPPAMPPAVGKQQILPSSVSSVVFPGSVPINSSIQPPTPLPPPPPTSTTSEKLPPYPLFPPGLIPGMVRKMQIGSGVPYSPLSPLDIPTVIPPADISSPEILERVSKFFKEIGEVNPSEGPMRSSTRDNEYDEYERRESPRKGGACIPPPPNLHMDRESGTYADGSVDRKSSGSGRLGLGATANPNEPSQYDDVYTSYRKQRSTTYHSSMSARAATR